MTVALEDYIMIGDGETVALLSKDGSIDWLCLPRFDSPACCAALLGDERHGLWSLSPVEPVLAQRQSYRKDTLIAESEFVTQGGKVRVVDFMAVRKTMPVLVRLIEGVEGEVALRSIAAFRFDYGNMPPWIVQRPDDIELHAGPDRLQLYGDRNHVIDGETLLCDFTLKAGERSHFVLSYTSSLDGGPIDIDIDAELKEAERDGRDWLSHLAPVHPDYDATLRRSLLTLRSLIHRPTGGLVAAPTTSLPEQPGGAKNWDYRFCWLRDAAFTLNVFLECGYLQEAQSWRDWMLRAVAGAPDKIKIMYRVDGSRRLDEAILDWLPGYRFARPVRIGNAAAGQLQLDVWGELISTLHQAERAGMKRTEQGRHLEHAVMRHVEMIWREPDQGVWESRGEPRHHVYSKAMAWVAFDRFLKGRGEDELSAARRRTLVALKDTIHRTICEEGFNPGLNSFVSYFGGTEVDASLLLLHKIGFLPMSDPRMKGTLERIERTLVKDHLVWRHVSDMQEGEGAFLACSGWLAECRIAAGRPDDARAAIDALISITSSNGLLSEEYDTQSRHLNGNYPQALSHLALCQAILALSRPA
ncbi:glycoside hydrolase family 15 protein [Allorhizobium sp. BGMRC 0089]|uniref:glycoside hydrolase family 15 protein n=1 Tax=Allorhizobium sonneratiae TaxID=2934936 RepID=UPI002033DA09|nr:glycoside hydrolase family 15 protein [Allorhizobium sonneratiae]MCM2294594.1 glycoside hydrolase family 15 protein [Allorhizobium sonneratiae]